MKRRRVVILSMSSAAGDFYRNNLIQALGPDILDVVVHTPSSLRSSSPVTGVDLYLISTGSINYTDNISDWIPLGVPTVDIVASFQKQSLDLVASIPEGTRCLFVNTTQPLALEIITALNRYSLYNVLPTPWYPGCPDSPDIRVAITPGEPQLVPPYVEKIYDLGYRPLSPGTISRALLALGMESLLETERFRQYSDLFHPFDCEANSLLDRSVQLEAGVDLLINSMEGGLIGINEEENIFCINQNALDILELENDHWVGRPYTEAVPFIDFKEYAGGGSHQSYDKLLQYRGTSLNVGIHTICRNGKFRGLFLSVQRFNDVEEKQHTARLRLLNRGHTAKYTFDDIIGESQAMRDTCRMARKMARTNSAILITGESGTGKELLASAIHNASTRAAGPYIAINCAAMPENLLESELFGYENGAFTGAKKGGKLGLFECAHQGTLFLDEIEGMSPALQLKLLRVLQEKEVMRLGGTKIIRVDVRIIAATNVDMETLVKAGAIRKDLYYRLNTMELTLPPLRRRREDIPLLIRHLQDQSAHPICLSQPVMDHILAHSWDGNVRELKNYIEFFQCLEKDVITLDDLPQRLRGTPSDVLPPIPFAAPQAPIRQEDDSREEQFILHCLYQSYLENRLIGRRTICQQAKGAHLFLTEQEVRRLLKQLEDKGLVKVGKGRAGSRLTPAGITAVTQDTL